MPRLLIATTVPITLSAFLLPFARHFRARGWRVDALTRSEAIAPELAESFDHIWTVGWSRSPLGPRNLLATPRAIRQIVAREGYDIVHAHTAVAGFVTRFALRAPQRRGELATIYTAHGFNFDRGIAPAKNAAFVALEKLAGRWTDYIVVINRQDEAAARRLGLVPADRVCYMPGIGLDITRYAREAVAPAEAARVRAELGLGPAEPLFLMVAEFIPRKRHEDAIRAFARLGEPSAQLAFAGEGPLSQPMRELAARLGVSERVHFLGYRRDIPALMRASAAVLLPSGQEGLPRSVMEAMALGVAVIGSDIRGVRDLLAGGAGLLARVGDVEQLSRALAWVLAHPAEARAIGLRGQAQAAQYDLRAVIALHEALYARALAERRPQPEVMSRPA